jgi:hypothetical protein
MMVVMQHLMRLLLIQNSCHSLNSWESQFRLLLLLLLLLLTLNAIVRGENGVNYLSYIILDVTVELSTHCFEHWQDCLLEDSRLLYSSTN